MAFGVKPCTLSRAIAQVLVGAGVFLLLMMLGSTRHEAGIEVDNSAEAD